MFSEKNLHKYGTPLPMLELDQVPSKKPVHVQDQIATDEQGRRRFHGAFTGGFSAGYWNTVGSKEGWTPQTFKSSRSEKAAEKFAQKPEDFMDDEDRGEFGIAPKGLQINEDFTSTTEGTEKRKRKFFQGDSLPIPGEPVLQQLIRPIKDKVAVRILKTWGWRPGQGIGPRQTRKEKKKAKERNKKELYLLERYGCDLPGKSKAASDSEEDDEADDSLDDEEDITFAPEDCELPPYALKQDNYGIGYEPLSRKSVLGATSSSSSLALSKTKEHFSLFPAIEAVGKNNQKISFTGQGFGVGALEEDDDEDVYARDDMTRYDFTLEDKKKKKVLKKSNDLDDLVFGQFVLDRNPPKLPVYKQDIPFGWHPRNWHERRSRFDPIDPRKQKNIEQIFPNTSREETMTREKRAELLGEELKTKDTTEEASEKTKEIKTKSVEELQKEYKERKEKTKSLIERITAKSSSFTKGGLITIEGEEQALSAEDISSSFKPFANNIQKQKRYELYLAKEFKTEQEIEDFLKNIQPIELSLWDRQMELQEFQQAKKLYKPLKGIMSDRFVTESEIKAVEMEAKKVDSQQIVVERSKVMWKPHSLLCKRFNIAEPFRGLPDEDKKSKNKNKKMSVFDYLETSVNTKKDFQTPVIIPKNIEKPKEIIKQSNERTSTESSPKTAETQNEKDDQQPTLEWQDVLNPKEKSSNEKKSFTFKPKTDLEKKVVESINKPIEEKKELFKSIFSDSESEDEDQQIEEDIIEDVIPALSKPLNAAAANLLRNTSPPRGIFKALFNTTENLKEIDEAKEKQKLTETTKENPEEKPLQIPNNPKDKPKIVFKPKSLREPKEPKEPENPIETPTPNLYGPALPQTRAPTSEADSLKNSIDDKLLQLFNKHKPTLKVTEEWIEKGKNDSSDPDESSSSEDSSEAESIKHKKKSKKSKKKSSSEHKHKKHKDRKSSKKSKKSDKKKKKHKK